jgi:DNA polymerase-3 subunit alpha
VALTDHRAFFGVVDSHRLAVREGVRPIIGVEAYLAPRGMQDREPRLDGQTYRLLLLAENGAGYRNLLELPRPLNWMASAAGRQSTTSAWLLTATA